MDSILSPDDFSRQLDGATIDDINDLLALAYGCEPRVYNDAELQPYIQLLWARKRLLSDDPFW